MNSFTEGIIYIITFLIITNIALIYVKRRYRKDFANKGVEE